MTPNRRQFLNLVAGASAATVLSSTQSEVFASYPTPIAANSYNWYTFYGRDNKNWGEDLDACLADFAKTGLKAYEPSFNSAEEVIKLGPVLKKYQIAMP